MVMNATSAAIRHRPAMVWAVIATLGFLGVTAVAGGIAMVLDIGAAPPREWLDGVPLIDSWLVPGLVLAIGFGLGSLVAAYGMLRQPDWRWLRPFERITRHHWSWLATLLIGLGHIAWIAIELIYLPQPSALQVVYGAVGAALVLLPLHPAVRAYSHSAVTDERAGALQPGS